MVTRFCRLVHGVTPLEENRSFLEKVQLGELLAGLERSDPLKAVAEVGSSAATSSAALFQLAAAAASLNNPLLDDDDAFLATTTDDDDDLDPDLDLDEEVVRRPAIRWQDTHGHLPLASTANLNGANGVNGIIKKKKCE